ARGDERAREAAEQVRVFGRLATVLIFGVALRIVNADADDLFRRQDRRQQLHILELIIGSTTRRRARLPDRASPEHIEQGRVLRQLLAEIDNACVSHRAVAHAAIGLESCQTQSHTSLRHWCCRALFIEALRYRTSPARLRLWEGAANMPAMSLYALQKLIRNRRRPDEVRARPRG